MHACMQAIVHACEDAANSSLPSEQPEEGGSLDPSFDGRQHVHPASLRVEAMKAQMNNSHVSLQGMQARAAVLNAPKFSTHISNAGKEKKNWPTQLAPLAPHGETPTLYTFSRYSTSASSVFFQCKRRSAIVSENPGPPQRTSELAWPATPPSSAPSDGCCCCCCCDCQGSGGSCGSKPVALAAR
jgi:hypothetical protein